MVGNVFKSGEEANHQQMIQQLEPSQRQGSHPQQSTSSSLTNPVEAQDEVPEVSNGLPPWRVSHSQDYVAKKLFSL